MVIRYDNRGSHVSLAVALVQPMHPCSHDITYAGIPPQSRILDTTNKGRKRLSPQCWGQSAKPPIHVSGKGHAAAQGLDYEV